MNSQQSPVGGQQSPVGGQQSPVGGQQSPVGGQQSPVGGQQSPVGSQQSPVGGQRSNPLRIAQVAPVATSVPPPKSGSVETMTSLLTEGLVARGHDVTL